MISVADIICSSIEIEADSNTARAFDDLKDLLCYAGNGDMQRGLRELLRMMIDAADGAADVHGEERFPAEHERLVAFSAAIKAASEQIRA
jgi:hypothetical protein